MRPVLVILAGLSYVIHMTLGCCFMHEHGGLVARPLDAVGCHSHIAPSTSDHHSHNDHSADAGQRSPADCPHDHSDHDDSCLGLLSIAKVNLQDDAATSFDLVANGISFALTLAERPLDQVVTMAIAAAPPVRAHLAKLVITI